MHDELKFLLIRTRRASIRAVEGEVLHTRRQSQCQASALYTALVAARFNLDLKAKYNNQLIAQGKPPKVSITVVMRKLIVIANTLLKADRLWVRSLA